jgi:hypothetical protein
MTRQSDNRLLNSHFANVPHPWTLNPTCKAQGKAQGKSYREPPHKYIDHVA